MAYKSKWFKSDVQLAGSAVLWTKQMGKIMLKAVIMQKSFCVYVDAYSNDLQEVTLAEEMYSNDGEYDVPTIFSKAEQLFKRTVGI